MTKEQPAKGKFVLDNGDKLSMNLSLFNWNQRNSIY